MVVCLSYGGDLWSIFIYSQQQIWRAEFYPSFFLPYRIGCLLGHGGYVSLLAKPKNSKSKMKLNIFLTILIALTNVSFSSGLSIENRNLLLQLDSNFGWRKIESTYDNISISIKEISSSNLNAIKVEKIVDLEPELITKTIMDVENYDGILSNNNSLQSRVIRRSTTGLIGYQHIKIDIPLFDDREYFFQMNHSGFGDYDSNTLCHWVLLDANPINDINGVIKGATYLSFGAGIWKAEATSSNKYKISYRLYIDPGGSIPNFLIDMINKQSIVGLFRDIEVEVIAKSEIGI